MSAEKWSTRRWLLIALGLFVTGLLTGILATLICSGNKAHITDERLMGTWQSDADRTFAEIRQRRPLTAEHEALFRKLFGRLKVTYTPTTGKSLMDGVTETFPIEILDKDAHSVVLRTPNSPQGAAVGESEFTLIKFDGSDSFSLITGLGTDIREYFKRIP